MNRREIKCECVYEGKECDRLAKVRVIKKELLRSYNRKISPYDVDAHYDEIIHERFLCVGCAIIKEDYKIVEWIVPKIPYEILFGLKGFSLEDASRLGLRYWELMEEKRLRWGEQIFCHNCGNKITHEVRYYTDNDGYDSPNRWVNAHRTIHCKNCGFFDFMYQEKRFGYDWKKADAGEYHGYKKPDNDPDYKKWVKIQKDLVLKSD